VRYFKTEWVEYPDIETVCLGIGAKPTTTKSDGSPKYTLPVIYDPSTKLVISDSIVIAKYLEKQYPDTTKLFPDGSNGLIAAFLDAFQTTVSFNIFRLIVLGTHNVLNEASQGS